MKKLSVFFSMNLTVLLIAAQSLASITSTSPSVYYVASPTSVMLNAWESSDQIILFDELQSFTLTSDVILDITSPGNYPADVLTPGMVSAGTTVDVHLLHLDPVGVSDEIRLLGDITFGADILGVIVSDNSLYASDWLGNPTTTYPTVGNGYFAQRELEFRPQDFLTLSADMRTLSVDFLAQNILDEARIITNAVPIPGAVWLLGSGLIGLVGLRTKFMKEGKNA